MKPAGRNKGGYYGDTILIRAVLQSISEWAASDSWDIQSLTAAPGCLIPILHRPGAPSGPRLYLSTGIHGDEPAGPLAAMRLLRESPWPEEAEIWLCPCLNPTGFERHRRENQEGIDLNRDYRSLRTPEVRAHVQWLSGLPDFDLALLMHEDWEADGFYLYEVGTEPNSAATASILSRVARVCPIASATLIDGRSAAGGIIRPPEDPWQRPDWPEAIYLIQHKTDRLYNFESPSDYPMETRVDALVTAVAAAIATLETEG